MSMDAPARPLAEQYSDIRWGAVIAGAVAAAALAFVLEGFALGIGFSVSSTAPTWRDTSIALVLASGFYLVLVAIENREAREHQRHAGRHETVEVVGEDFREQRRRRVADARAMPVDLVHGRHAHFLSPRNAARVASTISGAEA